MSNYQRLNILLVGASVGLGGALLIFGPDKLPQGFLVYWVALTVAPAVLDVVRSLANRFSQRRTQGKNHG